MSSTPRNPYLAVDILVEIDGKIVLIERKNPPFGWALPGGFVDYGESVEAAAVREAKEELSLDVTLESLLYVYSNPSRDPRFHVASVAFVASTTGTPIAADDAMNVALFDIESLPTLAFDHQKILQDYVVWKHSKSHPLPT